MALGLVPVLLSARAARAEPLDRVAVRFAAAETGGLGRPRFLTERQVSLFARVEARNEDTSSTSAELPERYVRTAVDRLIARAMLAGLLVQQGREPPDLAGLTAETRADLEARVGGAAELRRLLTRETLDDAELAAFVRDQVRAAYAVDRAITPILAVNEEQLREAFRGANHPYKSGKLDDVRRQLKRWLINERLRAAELEFLQGARTRVRVGRGEGWP